MRSCLASIDHAADTELAARDRRQVHLDRTVTCSALLYTYFRYVSRLGYTVNHLYVMYIVDVMNVVCGWMSVHGGEW